MAFVKITTIEDFPPGSLMEVLHGDRFYAVCNVAGEVRAVDGLCPHAQGALGDGRLNGETITCPVHMWDFDSKTGECSFNPKIRVGTYTARVHEGDVEVDLPNA